VKVRRPESAVGESPRNIRPAKIGAGLTLAGTSSYSKAEAIGISEAAKAQETDIATAQTIRHVLSHPRMGVRLSRPFLTTGQVPL
jgi:hypothetical protein